MDLLKTKIEVIQSVWIHITLFWKTIIQFDDFLQSFPGSPVTGFKFQFNGLCRFFSPSVFHAVASTLYF